MPERKKRVVIQPPARFWNQRCPDFSYKVSLFYVNTALHIFPALIATHLEPCFSRHTRACPGLTDSGFIMNCLKRIITRNESGRDFLQFLHEVDDKKISRSTFFETLKSPRRQAVLRDVDSAYQNRLSRMLSGVGIDFLEAFPEIAGYDVFIGDGHFIEHPTHTKNASGKKKVYAAGNLYVQNIRNGLMQLFTNVTDGSAKEHELPHFKHEIMKRKTDRKTIWVLDRAYIDNRFWEKQKKCGNYVISRTKSNKSVTSFGNYPFDKHDPVNAGVLEDQIGGFTNTQSTLRIIYYINPETGDEMTFYTTVE